MGISYFREDIFRIFNISHTQDHEFFQPESSLCHLYNHPNYEKTRGWPPIISTNKICKIEWIS